MENVVREGGEQGDMAGGGGNGERSFAHSMTEDNGKSISTSEVFYNGGGVRPEL